MPASLARGFRSLPETISDRAHERPQALALSHGAVELDYGGLASLVDDLAGRLARAGVHSGERLALVGSNSIEWATCFLACLRTGAVVVPLNRRLSPSEIARQLETCRPRMVVADDRQLPALESLCAERELPLHGLDRVPAGARSVWWLPSGALDDARPRPGQPALISFTSGTTGRPKGAVVSHGALVRSASSFVPRLETSSEDSTLVVVPLFHNTGFVDQLVHMLLVGGAVDLVTEYGTEAALDALARRPATYLIAVPSIYRLLMLDDRADEAFAGCRVAVYGGAPMPEAWVSELAARWPGMRLFNCYGLTEFTSVSHLLGPEDALARAHSVGRPVEGVRQRIVDEDGRLAPAGSEGEIELAGPMRMIGYWEAGDATAEVFRGEWLRTGDLGFVDGDGFLVLNGRAAEVINRGGEKIHAVQVEAALAAVDAVAEAAVVGTPHPILNERVVAFVVLAPGQQFDEDAARRVLARHVPDYAVPERFAVVDALPRNPAGKLDRQRLRAAMDEEAEGREP